MLNGPYVSDCKYSILVIFTIVTLGYAGEAQADRSVTWINGNPTQSQIEAIPPSPVRPKLSYQTRISQTELPILEGLVYSLEVKYVDLASNGHCVEEFRNVRILDSVLNLELGLNAGCDFAREIANKQELSMILCFSESQDNNADTLSSNDSGASNGARCFNREVKISSVPYAIRVNIAREAESVYQANYAHNSSYVYRLADQGTDWSRLTIPSHFSFRTKRPAGLGPSALGLSADDNVKLDELSKAGYIRWHREYNASTRPEEADHLYIAQAPTTPQSGSSTLDQLTLASRLVDWYGPNIEISRSQRPEDNIKEGASQTALSVRGKVNVTGDLTIDQGLAYAMETVEIGGHTTVTAGGLFVSGEVNTRGNLQVTESLEQGWRDVNLTTNGPKYLFTVSGPLHFTGPLTLNPLYNDSQSSLVVGSTRVSQGSATLIVTDHVTSAGHIKIDGDVNVNGATTITMGQLDIENNLQVTGDVEVHKTLQINHTFSLLRGNQSQAIMYLIGDQDSDKLAINFDPAGDEATATSHFTTVEFDSQVQFSNEVTFEPEPSFDIEPECEIRPATVNDPNASNFNKLIPDVFDITCGGVTIRVSALLESDCGNTLREGDELCDEGPNNLGNAVTKYCDLSSTPFNNCRFFRRVEDNDGTPIGDQTSCEVANGFDVVLDNRTIKFYGQWRTTEEAPNGECALQSDDDDENLILNALGSTLTTTTDVNDNITSGLIASSCSNSDNCNTVRVTYPKFYCRADCTYARCGDGVVDPIQVDESEVGLLKEECDDGNLVDNDDCDNLCQFVTSCKLEVTDRISSTSAFVEIDTTQAQEVSSLPPVEKVKYYSESQCVDENGNLRFGDVSEAPQRVVEVDIAESTMIAFQTYQYTLDAQTHSDPFLIYREGCDQVVSSLCDDSSGGNTMAMIAPRHYEAGRHYIVVGGGINDPSVQGKTYLGVKFTCEEQDKLLASIYHKGTDPNKSLVFQPNLADQGRIGHVQTTCLNDVPSGFIQPTEVAFNADRVTTGLGLHQVAIELILETESEVSVTTSSNSIDSVIYIKSGCEEKTTLRSPTNSSVLLCNDNVTENSANARLEHTLPRGVYYIIVDTYSLNGGLVNITLDVQ